MEGIRALADLPALKLALVLECSSHRSLPKSPCPIFSSLLPLVMRFALGPWISAARWGLRQTSSSIERY